MKKESKGTRQIEISGRKTNGKVVTNRRVVNPRRRVIDRTPIIDDEWDRYFEDHQYGYGADTVSTHAMDFACERYPFGPWFDRYP